MGLSCNGIALPLFIAFLSGQPVQAFLYFIRIEKGKDPVPERLKTAKWDKVPSRNISKYTGNYYAQEQT
jgi:hypothetical protein